MAKTIILYVLYDTIQNKLIAEMDSDKGELVLGAVDPTIDGNHYRHIVTSSHKAKVGSIMGLEAWWNWVCESDAVKMSSDFPFNEKDVVIKMLASVD